MGLIDGVLPVTFSLDSEDSIEEEQRLFYVAVTRAKNRLFLTLHHEGTRGGIAQFNKVSRFVDMPNVLAKLDVRGSPGRPLEKTHEGEPREASRLYDKAALLRKIIESYK